jgi:hypothetical protein
MARGEFVQYFDSDDFLMPRKFEVQVKALHDHPECDIAYCRSSLIDQHGNTLREPSKWTGRKMDALFPALLVDRWWHTHTPLYRRSLCDKIGPWPDKRPEDWDYDARAGALGARLIFCDEVLSCQRHHDGHRVSTWSFEQYLPQEAWFLPRLYDCAIKARVPYDAPEMRHFVQWAFALSRAMAERNQVRTAEQLLTLAGTAGGGLTFGMLLYLWLSRLFGWRTVARFANRGHQLIGRCSGPETMAVSQAG